MRLQHSAALEQLLGDRLVVAQPLLAALGKTLSPPQVKVIAKRERIKAEVGELKIGEGV